MSKSAEYLVVCGERIISKSNSLCEAIGNCDTTQGMAVYCRILQKLLPGSNPEKSDLGLTLQK